jgi:hypothetical protein
VNVQCVIHDSRGRVAPTCRGIYTHCFLCLDLQCKHSLYTLADEREVWAGHRIIIARSGPWLTNLAEFIEIQQIRLGVDFAI